MREETEGDTHNGSNGGEEAVRDRAPFVSSKASEIASEKVVRDPVMIAKKLTNSGDAGAGSPVGIAKKHLAGGVARQALDGTAQLAFANQSQIHEIERQMRG